MKIIFLDIDGVLNSERFFEMNAQGLEFGHSQLDPDAVERLNRLIEETGAKVVISSSWRHVWSRDEIVRMLEKRGFKHGDTIIGITPTLAGPRGDEVAEWLGTDDERRRIDPDHSDVESYVILDDSDDFHDPEMRERFVNTTWEIGMTDEDVNQAIYILGSK
jgi:hypothetical protein